MGDRVSTVIVEPRLLVREALASLMESHSYHVICGVAASSEIDPSALAHTPKLVILGTFPAENAAMEASNIHRLWPQAKIILLFENASATDFKKLLTSPIDACIPLLVSPDALVTTLKLIVVVGVRIVLVGLSDTARNVQCQEEPEASAALSELRSEIVHYGAMSSSKIGPVVTRPTSGTLTSGHENEDSAHSLSLLRSMRSLSEREVQILKGLVKGHSNKLIAHSCAVTEATVKVHMKSILRKIRVANRTQAAVWALEHGYAHEDV